MEEEECIDEPRKAPSLPEIHQAIFDELNASKIEELILQHTQHLNLQTLVPLWGHKRSSDMHADECNGDLAAATPLHLAVLKGDTKIIDTLLSRGANPSLCCTFSAREVSGPFSSASCSFNIQEANALHLALFLGDTKAVKSILRGASDPKSLIETTMGGFSSGSSRHSPDTGTSGRLTCAGATALHIPFFASLSPAPKRTQKDVASYHQRDNSSTKEKPVLELIELMLEFGPAIDVTMREYGHVRVNDGCFDSDTSSQEFHDLTPLHLAGISGYNTPVMKRMLQAGAGADPNKTFRVKSSHVHEKMMRRHRDKESEKETKPSLSEQDREIPLLHYLLIEHSFESEQVQALLDSGADTSLKVKTLLVNELLQHKNSYYSSLGKSLETTAPEIDYEGLREGLKIPRAKKPKHQRKKKGETGKEKDKKKGKGEEKTRLVVGNTATAVETEGGSKKSGSQWRWCCFVRGESAEMEDRIESVTFTLHPTFNPPQVTVTEKPFEIRRLGWGTFVIKISITLKSHGTKKEGGLLSAITTAFTSGGEKEKEKKVVEVEHTLDFSKEETSTTVEI